MNVGGPAWEVTVLARGLNEDRFEVSLLAGEVDEGEADFIELRDPDLPVTKISSLGRSVRFGDDFRAFLAVRRTIRKFRPDIVHTHTAKAGVVGRLAAISCGVPIRVHTFHGHLLHGYFGPVVSRALIIVERLLAHGTTALIAVGEQVRDDLVAVGIGDHGKFTVIPPGVAPAADHSREFARQLLEIPTEVPVVVFVGRLTSIKRPDRLLDAMSLLLEQLPDALLVVAGDGDLMEETRSRAANMGSSIRLLGWQREVGLLYAAADCVVITSDNEGMPVTLIEAAMAGVPGVTTNVGSADEVVLDGKTGRVVDCSAQSVAGGLLEMLNSADRQELGAAAKVRAEHEFSLERLVAHHEDLYERLVTESRTGGGENDSE
jgi:glycosyltransferase involved in cell wall biosynthesis